MPIVTGAVVVPEPVLDKVVIPELRFTFENPAGPGMPKTYVIEDSPKIRNIHLRHQFKAGPYSDYRIQKPWSYMLLRVNRDGRVCIGIIYFANKRLETVDEPGLLAAPLPNVDYATDHAEEGICFYQHGKKWGPTPEEAALNAHSFFWGSDFNTGVTCYKKGRPAVITGKRLSWRGTLLLWKRLTVKGIPIEWVPIQDRTGRPINTLKEAFESLSGVRDFNYE